MNIRNNERDKRAIFPQVSVTTALAPAKLVILSLEMWSGYYTVTAAEHGSTITSDFYISGTVGCSH